MTSLEYGPFVNPRLIIHCRRQIAHLYGGNCQKQPSQITYKSVDDFLERRSLRNGDGTWMRLYSRETCHERSYLTSLFAIGSALLKTAIELGVEGTANWMNIKHRSLWVLNQST